MGSFTRLEIVTRGMARAGNTGYQTEAEYALNAFLLRTAADYPWPKLHRSVTGVALGEGAQSISFGNGSSGVTRQVQRILNPLWVYKSDFTIQGRTRVRVLTGGLQQEEDRIQDPTKSRGLPYQVRVRPDASVDGRWTIIPWLVPDQAYQLAVDYIELPAVPVIGTAGDATVPWYPSDETMVQCVCTEVVHNWEPERWAQELSVLAALEGKDKGRYGTAPGINDQMGDNFGLDRGVFR
jgi:hypothetical protein